MKIGIIDYGMGNTGSVTAALRGLGAEPLLTASEHLLDGCAALILPGVGAFSPAMERLTQLGLNAAIRRWADKERKPLLGICLGMQLLAEDSTEGHACRGLGLIEGHVVRLAPAHGLPVLHVGWNEVHADSGSDLFLDIPPGSHFFFDHSYHIVLSSSDINCATFNYGGAWLAAFQRGNVFGVQFHPEKSQHAGTALLKNFLRYASVVSANSYEHA